jgi:hypothetical protein
MRRVWGYIVALLAGAVSAVLIALRLKKPEPVRGLNVDDLKQLEAHHAHAVAEKQREIESLRADLAHNVDYVRDLELQVAQHRRELARAYVDSGKSAEEIAEAFKGLKL